MKYLILLLDGGADEPISSLGNKTAFEFANLTNINRLASLGEVGSIFTVAPNIVPSSDAANLAIMGYDPQIYLTGRAPLEAISLGIEMGDTDMAYRASTITLLDPHTGKPADEFTSTKYEDLIIADYSASLITTEEAKELIDELREKIKCSKNIEFYAGVSYRHLMILRCGEEFFSENGETGSNLSCRLKTPQDNIGKRVGDCLPEISTLTDIQKKSYEILKGSKINKERVKRGLNPANAVWLWGEGIKPNLPKFKDKYGISAAVISAVDLIKGIAIGLGMRVCKVEGATGTLDTNYDGKCAAAIEEYRQGTQLVYMHMEGPDECGHQGDIMGKVESLERIDRKILCPILEYFKTDNIDYKVLVLPDHKTPVELRVHTKGEVPFLIYDSTREKPCDENRKFTEEIAKRGKTFKNGYEIMDYFVRNNF